MSADGSDGKGVKPPRTLFSLGRPGAKVERGGAAVAVDPPVGDRAEELSDEEIQYACGACGALLPTGAAFCGECGTPVATDDYYEEELLHDEGMAPGGLLDEAVVADDEPVEAEAQTDVAAAPDVPTEAVPVAEQAPADEPAAADAADHGHAGLVACAVAGGAVAAGAAHLAADHEAGVADLVEEHVAADEPVATSNVLYADPSVVEPPPPAGDGGLQVSDPVTGTAAVVDGAAPAAEDATAPAVADLSAPAAEDTTAVAAAPTTDPTTVSPTWGDPTTTADDGHGAWAGGAVAGAAVAGAAVAGVGAAEASPLSELSAPPAPPLDGTTSTDMPYGHGPLESSQKSKAPMMILVGVGAVLVLAGIIGVIIAMAGSKNENVATAPSSTAASSTTAKASSTTTTAASSSTSSSSSTSTTAESTTTTAAPETSTTAAPTTQTTAPPQVATPGLPSSIVTIPPQVTPGRIQPNPAAGTTFRTYKNQQFQIQLTNVGGSPASFQLRGDGYANGGGSGSVPPNSTVTVTFTASPAEGLHAGAVSGFLEGLGNYSISINTVNG